MIALRFFYFLTNYQARAAFNLYFFKVELLLKSKIEPKENNLKRFEDLNLLLLLKLYRRLIELRFWLRLAPSNILYRQISYNQGHLGILVERA